MLNFVLMRNAFCRGVIGVFLYVYKNVILTTVNCRL